MFHLEGKLTKTNIKIELSSQNYVDPYIFVPNPEIFLHFPTTPPERYTRPAGRTRDAQIYTNRQPKGCNNRQPKGYNNRQPKGCNK